MSAPAPSSSSSSSSKEKTTEQKLKEALASGKIYAVFSVTITGVPAAEAAAGYPMLNAAGIETDEFMYVAAGYGCPERHLGTAVGNTAVNLTRDDKAVDLWVRLAGTRSNTPINPKAKVLKRHPVHAAQAKEFLAWRKTPAAKLLLCNDPGVRLVTATHPFARYRYEYQNLKEDLAHHRCMWCDQFSPELPLNCKKPCSFVNACHGCVELFRVCPSAEGKEAQSNCMALIVPTGNFVRCGKHRAAAEKQEERLKKLAAVVAPVAAVASASVPPGASAAPPSDSKKRRLRKAKTDVEVVGAAAPAAAAPVAALAKSPLGRSPRPKRMKPTDSVVVIEDEDGTGD
jgi:hypothetical protein